ncbi:MAG: adenylate/guanylate cyclase domain-containing protein [Porticoccaceae bacterium]
MSPSLRKKLSRPRDIQPGTVRKRLTIFFSDLVGFTKMSENMDPKDLNFVLNSYVNEMSTVAIEYGATIDKFMGDGMMAFFGDPQSKGTKEDAVQCVAMALEMQRRMPKLRAKWREIGIDADLHIRMGINSGFTTVGTLVPTTVWITQLWAQRSILLAGLNQMPRSTAFIFLRQPIC